jgi:hypothetical protein
LKKRRNRRVETAGNPPPGSATAMSLPAIAD